MTRKGSFSGLSQISTGGESYGGFSKNTTGSVASILSSSRVPSSARQVARARKEKDSDFVLSLNLSDLTLAEGMDAEVRVLRRKKQHEHAWESGTEEECGLKSNIGRREGKGKRKRRGRGGDEEERAHSKASIRE